MLYSDVCHESDFIEQDKMKYIVPDSNTTLIGRWANGPCSFVVVKGDMALLIYQKGVSNEKNDSWRFPNNVPAVDNDARDS